MLIAHHLVLSGYSTWLSNDPRGSGSVETRKPALRELGPTHLGRKAVQPDRRVLREFYRQAEPRVDFPVLWFDDHMRRIIGDAFGQVAMGRGYTIWACAVCSNHAHLCVRIHKDDNVRMFDEFANGARRALIEQSNIAQGHPVWASRPYDVFLNTPEDVRGRIEYIKRNPVKEKLPPQNWPFVKSYDNWPLHRRERSR